MEQSGDVRLQVIFSNVRYTLRHKVAPLSASSLAYVSQAEKFFDELIGSLDSLGSGANHTGADRAFLFVPRLTDVIAIRDDSGNALDQEGIDRLRKYFARMRRYLDKLERDPETFYASAGCKDLLNFADGAYGIYSPKYQVMADVPFVQPGW